MVTIFQTVLMHLAVCGLVASLVLLTLRSRMALDAFTRLCSIWRSLTAFGRVAVCSFLLVGVLVGGDKTNSVNNLPPQMMSPLVQQGNASILTGRPVNGNLINTMNLVQLQATGAERKAASWNVRGAWKDSFWLDFEDGWVFPWGTNHLSGVEVISCGQIWPMPFDTNAVATAGSPFEIVPGLTTFAYEFTPSNSCRFAWTDAAVNRDTNNLVSAALELFRCGDVAVTTNGVTWTIPRELPFDHDGFGQDAEWVAANFTNATEIAAAGGYAAWVDAQVGEGLTNGLYKLTVALTNTPPEVVNLTVGDWSVAVTNVGECVFLLEKGTRYEIGLSCYMDGFSYACDDGEEVAAPRLLRGPVNSPAYSVLLTASDDTGSVELVEPSPSGDGYVIYYPWLSLSPDHEVDPTFPILLSVSVFDLPQGAYPTVEWQTNNLTIATGENFFWYGDEDVDAIDVVATCRDATLHGHFSIERHVRSSEITLSGGGLIIVEDAYTNAPGEVVSASSTSRRLDFSWSLAEEGTLSLESNSAALALTNEYGTTFSLPYSWHGSVDEEDNWRLFASCADTAQTGHVGDFVFTFTPDAPTAATLTRTVGVDVVKIRVEAEADWPSNKVRHVFGPKERFAITSTPQVALSVGSGSFASVTNNTVIAPDRAGSFVVVAIVGEASATLPFECIAPTALCGGNPRAWESNEWHQFGIHPLSADEAGVAVHIDTWLEPSYVSYTNIRLFEGVAQPSDRQGWYLDVNTFPDEDLQHNVNAGASVNPETEYIAIGTSGNLTQQGDYVASICITTNEYFYGSYKLEIPLKWYAEAGLVTNSLPDNVQTVWIYSNGTMRIRKNGVVWERSLSGFECQVED